jgi:exo-beta-1,3-glucanase (GH17 family)
LKTIVRPLSCFVLSALAALPMAKPMEYICYSPYRDGQAPGTGSEPTEAQVREDFLILAPLVKGIRTYSSLGIHARIPDLAREAGLEVHVGAWIDGNEAGNQAQVEALIRLAKGGNPAIKGLIVGNEVLLRQDVSKARLLEYIRQVKDANTGVPVTTADIYQRIRDHAADLDPVVDYVMAHVHPYWEHQAVADAAGHVVAGWKQVKERYPGKQVIIGETGFPSGGQAMGGAVPSLENQARFTGEIAVLGAREGMRFMLFTSFDEAWKTAEGAVGGNWGIWRSDRSGKPAVDRVRALPVVIIRPPGTRAPRSGAVLEMAGSGLDILGRLRACGAEERRVPPAVWTLPAR